jgi:hypothetical protein
MSSSKRRRRELHKREAEQEEEERREHNPGALEAGQLPLTRRRDQREAIINEEEDAAAEDKYAQKRHDADSDEKWANHVSPISIVFLALFCCLFLAVVVWLSFLHEIVSLGDHTSHVSTRFRDHTGKRKVPGSDTADMDALNNNDKGDARRVTEDPNRIQQSPPRQEDEAIAAKPDDHRGQNT